MEGPPYPGQDRAMIDTDQLAARGILRLPALLSAAECAELAGFWSRPELFRSTVDMARHGFDRGTYRYFTYPLPDRVQALREALYPPLAAVANRWAALWDDSNARPESLQPWLDQCHAAGQRRPTPLLLRYGPGDYNCLHRDLYGSMVFPLQLTILLSEPGRDFEGGEFAVVEQRPRRQSRVEVVPLRQGDAVIFAVNERPERGARGWSRATLRHGVSEIRSGERFALGIIFHDAA